MIHERRAVLADVDGAKRAVERHARVDAAIGHRHDDVDGLPSA